MMPAAKHGDPQMGVDIHLCVVPPSPSPVPLPTPHMSIVFDPFDYVPYLGATVTVCGMKRAVAGTAGKAVHIPPGFPFAPKIPDTSDEIFMGSATVVADGNPFSFLAVPVLSCQVSGMPSPPRPKQQEKKMMLLPTTTNMAIPTNVFVGGPPTISLMGMAFKLGFAALGRFAKSSLFARVRQKLFGKMKAGFLKCIILRAEPVDITTGEVSVDQEDFTLPGRIPIRWVRSYRSGNRRDGACGRGWETPADIRLEVFPQDGSAIFLRPDGPAALFANSPAALGDEAAVLELWDGALLSDHGGEFRIRTKEDRIYHFEKTLAFANGDGVREHPLTRISDLCGNWLAFERSGRRLVRIRESAGRQIEITTDGDLIRQVALSVPDGEFRHVFAEYGYDIAGDLLEVLDALGNPYRFAYDQHHMVRHTDRNGLSFYYEYEQSGEDWRVVHTWGDGGLYDYRFGWLDEANEVRITDSLGGVSVVTLDDRRLPISELDALGGVTVYEYDDVGRSAAVVDQDGHRTEYVYDERGNLLRRTLPDGSMVATEFDARNKAVLLIDANGASWLQAFDGRGLLRSQRTPTGAETRYEHDIRGQLAVVENPLGSRTVFAHDTYGNPAQVTDALGHATRFRHNELGCLCSRWDAAGYLTTFDYDALGRPIRVTLPGGGATSFTYDPEGNMIRRTASDGSTIDLEYAGIGQMARRVEAGGRSIEYVYNQEEHLVAVRNQRGEVYQLRRDALGRVVEEIDYWGQRRSYAYTPAGHLREVRDPLDRIIRYGTDELGRMVERLLPSGDPSIASEVETFVYDGNGVLLSCENATARIQRDYDLDGRLIEERQGDEFQVSNAYDAAGNLVARTTVLRTDGHEVTRNVNYAYDCLARVTEFLVGGHSPLRRERNVLGQTVQVVLGSELRGSFAYTPDGQVAAQQWSALKGGAFWEQTHEYDSVGNLTGRHDSVLGTERYAYDAAGILTDHTAPDGQRAGYHSDPAGDRLITHVKAPVEGSDSRTDWLRVGQADDMAYCFDRAGNLVERADRRGATRFTWNANNCLTETLAAGQRTTYGYDALGRRVIKQTPDATTRFYWSGDVMIGESVIANAKGAAPALFSQEWLYIPGSFVPVATLIGRMDHNDAFKDDLFVFQNESNGCPMRIFDASATVVWEAQFGGWGDVTRTTIERVYNPLRLQGQYYDEESRLSYNRFRYYDAGIGQFVSQDPLGITIHPNPYHYAPNIHGWIDPLGLKCFELPAWKKVLVDWAHIEERHVAGGALTEGRTIFSGMSLDGVKAALRRAWPTMEKVEVQGERLLVRGFDEKSGYVIDAWYNKVTKTIETAFPPATHL